MDSTINRLYDHQGVAECMHLYVVSASLGGRMYAFLRGIRKSGWQNVYIFAWYPQVWVAESMHFYVVSASLGGRTYAFFTWYPQPENLHTNKQVNQ